MERHWRVTILFTCCMIYMFIGAAIFSSIEGGNEETTRASLNDSIVLFLEQHPSVSNRELMQLLVTIKDASDQGIAPDINLAPNNASVEWKRIEKPYRRNWDLPNAFFFSATVITTIGYGHLSPSTNLGRNICVLYAFIGIPFMGWLLAEVGLQCKERGHKIGEKIYKLLGSLSGDRGDRIRRVCASIAMFAIVYLLVIIIPALIYSHIEGWDFSLAHYFCFISLSTIGFGDYVATDNYVGHSHGLRWLYKVVTAVYFVFGLASVAIVFNSIQHRQQRRVKRIKAVWKKTTSANDKNGADDDDEEEGDCEMVRLQTPDEKEEEEKKDGTVMNSKEKEELNDCEMERLQMPEENEEEEKDGTVMNFKEKEELNDCEMERLQMPEENEEEENDGIVMNSKEKEELNGHQV